MKKARLADGSIVLAHQYNHQAHGGDLKCADAACPANMTFRKGTLTHGSAATRSAAFVSKSVAQHIATCAEYEDFKVIARRNKSVEEGLKEGKTIVLNLNMKLSDDFNAAKLPSNLIGVASTHEKGNYVTAPVRSVDDLLDLKKLITDKGGAAGLAKTVVNYKGKTLPIEEFVLDSREKFRALLNKMYKTAEGTTAEEIKEFPRLMTFKATQNTKSRDKGALRGTPMTFFKPGNNRLVLLQRAQVEKEFEQTLRGENVYMIGAPVLNVKEAKGALDALKAGNDQTIFLNLKWQVTGAHQFTPVEEPAPQTANNNASATAPAATSAAAPAEQQAAPAAATSAAKPADQKPGQMNLFKPK